MESICGVFKHSPIVLVVACLILVGSTDVFGQQTKSISFKAEAGNSKYTKQYSIDVDAHRQFRIFELHRTFPSHPPVIEGVRVKEESLWGHSDYVDLNGTWSGPGQYVMENGDKIYYWADGASRSTTSADGSRKGISTCVKHLNGGTGKFSTIRGNLIETANFDPAQNFNEAQDEGEYYMEK